jgi:hypothetical protein
MLRSIGLLLVVASAVGVVAVLQTFFEYGGFEFRLGSALALSFASYGLAIGVMLVRKAPPRRGALFWIAILSVARGALFAIPFGIGIALVQLKVAPEIGWVIPSNNWWPPKESLFHDTLWSSFYRGPTDPSELGFFQATSSIAGIFTSALFWVFVPLILYLGVLWSRPGGIVDKIFGWIAFALAILVIISAVETGYIQYERTTAEWPPGISVQYFYYPALHWYVLYAIEVLLFTATGVLLLRRQPRIPTSDSSDRA